MRLGDMTCPWHAPLTLDQCRHLHPPPPARCEDVGRGFCAASVDGYCAGGFLGKWCHG